MESLVYLLPLFGILGLVYMYFLFRRVGKQDAGDERMQGSSRYIAAGAMSLLKAEYRG